MSDRLREALETLAERTPPADPYEFAGRVLDAVPSRRRWMLPAAAAAAAAAAVALAVLVVADADREDRVVTTSTTSTTTTTISTVPSASWQRAAFPDPEPSSKVELTDVAVSGSRVLAVGTAEAGDMWDAVAYRSEDGGASWQQVPGLVGPPADEAMLGAVAVDGGFVVVGRSGPAVMDWRAVAWHPPDGLRWTQVPLGGAGSESAEGVARRGDRLVAVGASGTGQAAVAAAWYSDDRGRTWRRAAIDGAGYLSAVTATPTGFVAVGSGAWTSSDGRRWTRTLSGTVPHLLDVASGPGRVIAVGTYGAQFTSDDGTRWHGEAAIGGEHEIMLLSDGSWLAAGGSVVSSHDGRAWVRVVDPAFQGYPFLMRGLAELGDGSVVAVGSTFTSGGDDSDSAPAAWIRR